MKKGAKPKFKRPDKPKSLNTADETGTVEVRVLLIDKGSQAKKGNIIRSLRVADSTVTEVIDAIKEALFGEA